MEAFPNFTPFPRIQKVIDGVKKIALLGARTELCLSEHKRGAAEMLDAQLYDQPQLPLRYLTDAEIAEKYRNQQIIERTNAAQLDNTGGRWTDMGTYYSQVEEA